MIMNMNWNLDDYFVEIEGKFAARRGRATTISPQDWILIECWQHQGIPLAVVLGAIDEVFDQNAAQAKPVKINSLSYCQQAVEQRFAAWSENRIGAHDTEQLAPISGDDDFENWLIVNGLFSEYLTADFNRVKEIADQFEIETAK